MKKLISVYKKLCDQRNKNNNKIIMKNDIIDNNRDKT